jgi:hypothetical protein
LFCPYWRKKGLKAGNVDLIIGKYLKFSRNLCCFKKRSSVKIEKFPPSFVGGFQQALFIEITQDAI